MRSETLRGVALFGLSLLVLAVTFVLLVPPANQYEISLYDVYPAVFWVLLLGAMLVGSLVIFGSIAVPDDRSWVFGLLIVLLSNALLFLLPYIRGYAMYGRADPLTHLGYVRDIITTGSVDGNIYPPSHLLAAVVADATGLELNTLGMLLPVIFSTVYFGAMFYVLARLFDTRERLLFSLPFVLLPVLKTKGFLLLRPYDLSVMLVPFVLYLFLYSREEPVPPVRALFVLSVISLLLYHPLTGLFLIIVFAVYLGGTLTPRIEKEYHTPTSMLSLSAAIFVAWYSGFSGIIRRFESIYYTLFGSTAGDAPVEAYTRTTQETTPAVIDLIRVAIFKYGLELALFALAFAFVLLAALLFVQSAYIPNTATVMFAGIFLVFSFGGTLFLFSDLIVPPHRPFQIAKISAVILSGQFLYLLWKHVNWSAQYSTARASASVLTIIILVVVLILSVFSLYASPLQSSSNEQVTEMELEGVEWINERGNASTDALVFDINYWRFHESMYGRELPLAVQGGTAPPPRFNYTAHTYLGQSYESDRYMILNHRGRISYPARYPKYESFWRYTPADFDRVGHDRTVNHIYSNGGLDHYTIDGTRGRNSTVAARRTG